LSRTLPGVRQPPHREAHNGHSNNHTGNHKQQARQVRYRRRDRRQRARQQAAPDPRELRKFLRAQPSGGVGFGSRYSFTPAQVKKLVAEWEKAQQAPETE
jgi:hypothetical protein